MFSTVLRTIATLVLTVIILDAQPLCWNATRTFDGWKARENVTVTCPNGNLLLTDIRNDPQVTSPAISLDPNQVNRIQITYRATGTGRARGQLYFTRDGKFTQARHWRTPALTPDGQWHTYTLREKDLNESADWYQPGNITQLRLDPTDSPGGTIEIREIRLFKQGDIVKPLPPLKSVTPKLDEPAWPAITPELGFTPRYKYETPYFKACMIKAPQDVRERKDKSTPFYLRRELPLTEKPVEAWLQFVADDGATAFINGTQVCHNGNWRVPSVLPVTKYLNKGTNTLAFRYRNTYSAGGVMGELFVRYPDGTRQRFNTDGTFKSSDALHPGWNQNGFDDREWPHAPALQGPPSAPWTCRLDYLNFNFPQSCLKATVTPTQCKANDPVVIAADFQGTMPTEDVYLDLQLSNGNTIVWEDTVPTPQLRRLDNQTWRLELTYRLPDFLPTATYDLRFSSASLYLTNAKQIQLPLDIQRLKAIPGFTQKPNFTVMNVAGKPAFAVNGKPFYPVWGAPNQYVTNRHSDAKLNVVTVFTLNGQNLRWWTQCGQFNFHQFDRFYGQVAAENPNAWFMWDLTFELPPDWPQKYPDHMCRDDQGNVNRDGYRPNHSFASEQARKDIEDAMVRAITYLENAPYANRIIGYRINSGHTLEWLGWDPKPGRTLDFSPVAQKAFKSFAKDNYPDLKNLSVPSLRQRQELDEDEILWDPVKHENVIAYHDFYSNATADMLIRLCRKAKETVKNRKLIGTYYGYTATLNQSGASQLRAHYALKKVLDAKAVDFLISPHSYSVRRLGNTCGDMKPFTSLADHGIVSVIEDDSRTHNGPYIHGSNNSQTLTKAHTLAIVQRNLAIALCRNAAIFTYALCAGTEFDFPDMVRTMNLYGIAAKHCLEQKVTRNAEIAVVTSEDTIKAMPMLTRPVANGLLMQKYNQDGTVRALPCGGIVQAGESFYGNITRYAQIGAPTDYLLAEDLKDNPGNYKLYIFINCFTYDQNFLDAIRTLRKRPCTMLWVYAPGYTFNRTNSTQNMKQLTGFRLLKAKQPIMPAVTLDDGSLLGTPTCRIAPMFHVEKTDDVTPLGHYEDGTIGLASKRTEAATSLFCGPYQFTAPFLVKVAKQAGIFLYTRNLDPMEANSKLITLHARFPGQKTVTFRQKGDILDVFNRKIVARNTDTLTFHAPLHSTWLFYCGNDAEQLLEKLRQEP